ncbi:MAG: 2-hydroxychromene-2-carboxylate isomerase [Gammaproteobacteria bacterium]|nr:MAG: 2-hydroxychromene-2-carboxylate isomerase [Gammaproteobacteria bacterium]
MLSCDWHQPGTETLNKIDWYFDFISPFAYLASESLERLPDSVELQPRPVLFGGILQHWKTLGPAEIEPMRRFTFRHVAWLAERNGIALTLPPEHPFNPLKLLRLCIALGNDLALVQRLFRFVWAEGRSADNPGHWQALLDELGVTDGESLIGAAEVKAKLRSNTESAIERGLFGVPSFIVDNEIFWGFDAMEFLLAYLEDPGLLQSPSIRAADAMPEGPQRRI